MRRWLVLLACGVLFGCDFDGRDVSPIIVEPASYSAEDVEQTLEEQVVEASCATCQYGMGTDSCHLAVKIDGKLYFVEGEDIHDHGDPHGEHGMCTCARHAKVSGKVVGNDFFADKFELQDVKEDSEQSPK